jgi:transposase
LGGNLPRMTKETEARWTERVQEWRASGLSAEEFAANKGFKASSLHWASSQLRGAVAQAPVLEPSAAKRRRAARGSGGAALIAEAPRFLPVRSRTARTPSGDMVVEVGSARIRVSRGFDASLLGDVVRALGGGVR